MAVKIGGKKAAGQKKKATLDDLIAAAGYKEVAPNPMDVLHEIAKDVSEKTGLPIDEAALKAMKDHAEEVVTVEGDLGYAALDSAKYYLDSSKIGTGYLSVSSSFLDAKVTISDQMKDAIKEGLEPWLVETIKEVIANTPMPLPPMPPAPPPPDPYVISQMVEPKVFSLLEQHKQQYHQLGVMPQPILINEFSIPHDIQNYRLILRSSYGGQEYEVPMAILPKLLGKVLA